MESSEQTIRRLQRELKQKDTAIKQKDTAIKQKDTAIKQKDTAIKQNNRAIKQNNRAIKQNNRAISKREKTIGLLREQQLLREDSLWAVTDAGRSDTDTSLLHIREVIHGILHNSAKLAGITSYDLDQFDYICNDFVAESKRHNKDAPLFSEDETPDPGNRCLLDRRSVLLLALFRKRSNVTQDALGVLFDVDQSTVCRYLRFADSVLAGILPTADRMTRLVKKAETSEQLEQLMPDRTIIIDGTEVPRQRPQDKDKRKNTYSGKKKRFTINTTITTNRAGLILAAGRSFEGGTHDLTMIREDPIDFGRWSKSMYKKDTPEKDRIRVLVDKGYQGIANHYTGIALEMPEKKRPRTELTQQQKDSNKRISAKRVKAGHAIGRIKQWARMTDPYDGTVEGFREELAVCTGLANFQLLWDAKKKRPSLGY